jgi:hypothetical protein
MAPGLRSTAAATFCWIARSFVTTEWVTVAYFPIIPLISKRISYTRLDPFHTYDRSGHYVVQVMPLSMKQVLSVYSWVIALAASIALWAGFQEIVVQKIGSEDTALVLCLGNIAVLIALPYLLRRFAIWRGSRSFNRASHGLGPRSFD